MLVLLVVLAARGLVNLRVVVVVEVLVRLVVLDVSVGHCCEGVGVPLYIIGLIGVSWNLFSLIDSTIVSVI